MAYKDPEKKKEYDRKYYMKNREKIRAGQKRRRKENSEKEKARHKKYREENLEREKARRKKYYEENSEKEKARSKEYYEENPEKEKARNKKYREENPEKVKAKEERYAATIRGRTTIRLKLVRRREGIKERTPPWADEVAIARKYREAREMEAIFGVKFHVDHIIPLHGKNVSGLHIAENLQVLEAETNIKKGIKYG